MIKATSVSSFRSTRLILWCLTVLCHCLIVVFLGRTNSGTNTKVLNSVLTIVSIQRSPPDPESLTKLVTNKNRFKQQEIKNSTIKPTKIVDTAIGEPVAVENRSTSELPDNLTGNLPGKPLSNLPSNAGAAKDSTNLGSIADRYKLQSPKYAVDELLTPAQQAAQDVRSNSAKLTRSEKFAVATGTLDCIFQTRLPDGKVIREPGKWVVLPARSDGTLKPLAKAHFCVRFHQAEDENGNDLTAISSGIKGKL